MKKMMVVFGVLLSFVWAGEWGHDFIQGFSVRRTDGKQFQIIKKQLNNSSFPQDLKFGEWYSCPLNWLIDLRGDDGECIENLNFSRNTELKVVRHIESQRTGVHYFVKDYVINSQSVRLYKMYSCNCYVGQTQVLQRIGGIESVVWSSDFEPMHSIGAPTGEMFANPWEHSMYPLLEPTTKTTDSEKIRELLLASL